MGTSMNNEIYFVNSFTDEVFSGNPAGVVFHEKKNRYKFDAKNSGRK